MTRLNIEKLVGCLAGCRLTTALVSSCVSSVVSAYLGMSSLGSSLPSLSVNRPLGANLNELTGMSSS